jgi:hypothetical protein
MADAGTADVDRDRSDARHEQNVIEVDSTHCLLPALKSETFACSNEVGQVTRQFYIYRTLVMPPTAEMEIRCDIYTATP